MAERDVPAGMGPYPGTMDEQEAAYRLLTLLREVSANGKIAVTGAGETALTGDVALRDGEQVRVPLLVDAARRLVTAPDTGRASEATLEAVRAAVDTLEALNTGRASEATLEAVRARATLLATETTLDALRTRAGLLATETTLSSVLAGVDGLEGLLGRLPAAGAASEATLAGVLTAVDTLEALTAAVRDRLPAVAHAQPLTDAQLRAAAVKTTDAGTDLVEAGLVYIAGGETQTSVVTPNASLSIENPIDSGRNVYVRAWSVYADATATVRYYLGGTSTGAILTPINGILGGGLPSTSIVRMGAGVYTPGTLLAAASRVAVNAPLHAEGRYLKVIPGRMVTIRFIGPGATNTVDLNGEWIERPIPA